MLVQDRIDDLKMHEIDLSRRAVAPYLERDCVYIVPLQESLKLND